ncbi:hypothetical protein MRB53_030476 [Persea americana]|uniref:Uncharacterized protein n=1 Tax=Persea americana TaxID=3435 RepID=A0ACC2KMF8_PERAE|nr:hypothetical protein MRB53_030476 [Persea americana]
MPETYMPESDPGNQENAVAKVDFASKGRCCFGCSVAARERDEIRGELDRERQGEEGQLQRPSGIAEEPEHFNIADFFSYPMFGKQVEFTLGVLKLDMALLKDKPASLTETSTPEEKTLFNAWERSDRLSAMFLRMTITANIETSLPTPENAKDYMKAITDRFKTADKSLAGKLMADLTTMKFDGTRAMHEHVIEMTNLAAKLKNLGLSVDEAFLVQFILNSLPPQYGPFQIHYNTITDKWTVNGLAIKLVQEEARLNQQGIKVAHLVQGAGHKAGRKQNSGQKRAPPKSNEASQNPKKKKKENGFLTIKTINPSENFLFMGNKDKAPVEAIGTFRLVLDSGYQLDLCQTLYVLSISHNLVSSADAVQVFITEVERQLDRKVNIMRSDRGGGFYGRYDETGQHPGPFAKLLQKLGIVAQYTTPSSPWQNGVAERVPRKAVPKTSFELWKGWKPSLQHLQIWGCPAEARVYNPHEKKFDLKTISGYFIAYPEKSKGFRFYCPNHSTRIVETGNARFFEKGEISGSNTPQDVIIQEIKVPVPLPSIMKDVGNPPVVEPFNNEENPINDQQLHNEIIAMNIWIMHQRNQH